MGNLGFWDWVKLSWTLGRVLEETTSFSLSLICKIQLIYFTLSYFTLLRTAFEYIYIYIFY